METPKESYPLRWPAGWKRTTSRTWSQFGKRSIAEARDALLAEMTKLGATKVILSSNLRVRNDGLPMANQVNPQDPGFAVYFTLKQQQRVLACDQWQKVEENMWSIVKHVEALRGQQRWGVGSIDQAFAGYAALPEKSEARPWTAVLGLPHEATPEQIKETYRALAKAVHPDVGGTNAQMSDLNEAYAAAIKAKGVK